MEPEKIYCPQCNSEVRLYYMQMDQNGDYDTTEGGVFHIYIAKCSNRACNWVEEERDFQVWDDYDERYDPEPRKRVFNERIMEWV
ncbi:MAG: hypothetical protein FWF10_07365 [Clostridiales bacterium]|nr:hypothetical protein [Clostridiales bacterium]